MLCNSRFVKPWNQRSPKAAIRCVISVVGASDPLSRVDSVLVSLFPVTQLVIQTMNCKINWINLTNKFDCKILPIVKSVHLVSDLYYQFLRLCVFICYKHHTSGPPHCLVQSIDSPLGWCTHLHCHVSYQGHIRLRSHKSRVSRSTELLFPKVVWVKTTIW